MEVCRHCGNRQTIRRRRLCWNCSNDPEARALYRVRRRVKPATHPTDALPGSQEKILVLMGRARRRQELWHPDDAPLGGRPPLEKAG